MILDNRTDTLILQDGDSHETKNMSIDLESQGFLMRMMSKIYSDAIGSTIREWASNALDSHREAGMNDPIVVTLGTDNNSNYEFSVEDFGMGISQDTIDNIISKYGKSTKRNSNTQLGCFGKLMPLT